ncbi:DinB family protein [Winogradskyella luteola]|uniref:DinB family protein n=1 Tax=Winogradskyella luteola TaxID=2828330 RepID=A0A9X1F5R6_9FLAO|nr:DinB family protein [Winogradskyella luteola]MBV7267621.1 DinB family protein [Winogradskyella luteola]
MLTETLRKLFKRDLYKLKEEISLYNDEANLWKLDGLVSNSAGNLCLHLVGNLNHFIGAILGNTAYIRQRDLEFSLKDVPRRELIKHVDDTIAVVEDVLSQLTEADLQQNYKISVFKEPMTTEYFLVHLTTHLAYHLGQINYHRRLLDR